MCLAVPQVHARLIPILKLDRQMGCMRLSLYFPNGPYARAIVLKLKHTSLMTLMASLLAHLVTAHRAIAFGQFHDVHLPNVRSTAGDSNIIDRHLHADYPVIKKPMLSIGSPPRQSLTTGLRLLPRSLAQYFTLARSLMLKRGSVRTTLCPRRKRQLGTL